jgi:hypothetical protein
MTWNFTKAYGSLANFALKIIFTPIAVGMGEVESTFFKFTNRDSRVGRIAHSGVDGVHNNGHDAGLKLAGKFGALISSNGEAYD